MKKLCLKRKDTGRWWTYGNYGLNKFDKEQASFKVSKELKDLVANTPVGGYLNFAAFEDDRAKEKTTQTAYKDVEPDGGSNIPF